MKIAYYAEWDVTTSSGVLSKLVAQVAMWNQLGAKAELFIVSPSRNDAAHQPLNTTGIRNFEFFRPFTGPVRKFAMAGAVERSVQKIREYGPDVVYVRYTSWTPGLSKLLREPRAKVLELNSIAPREIPSYRLDKHGLYWALTRRMIQKFDGLCCVTGEIAEWASPFRRTVSVIANGYDIDKAERTDSPKTQRPQYVMSIGTHAPWHGLDRLLQLATRMPEADFHVIGIQEPNTGNVFFHGRLSEVEMRRAYANFDIGIGTLALERKGMREACPLKVREYIAHGLPAIGSYADTDLSGHSCFLSLSTKKADMPEWPDKIRLFTASWKGRRVPIETARDLVGARAKEEKRLAFLGNIISRPRS
jgi:glycosyltransferase involved in cell wall biosynthesis